MSILEFKVLLWIPNHDLLSQTLNNIMFYLSMFPAKTKDKTFQNKEKPYFGVTFAQRKFFLKTPAMYNCRGPPIFQYQRYRVYWSANPKLFITLNENNSINLLNQLNHLWYTSDLRVPWSKSLMRLTYFWLCPPHNY